MSDYENLPRVAHLLNESEVVINKGNADGMYLGQVLVFFAKGPEIADPITGNSLGALEVVRGRGAVIHLQDHLATVRSSETTTIYDDTSGFSGFSLTERRRARQAVVPFKDIGIGDFARPV